VPRLIAILFCITKFDKTICRYVWKVIYVDPVTVRRGDLAASSVRCCGVFERGMDWGQCKQEAEIKYIQCQYET
jgi:hypothetical protein